LKDFKFMEISEGDIQDQDPTNATADDKASELFSEATASDDNTISYRAYAKINLSLEVLSKRFDGYHELATVMQTIGLYDVIHVTPAPDLEFDCSISSLVDEDNLVWKAALRLFEKLPEGSKQGARIMLEKSIPIAGGLGGGSSDAAATLRALNLLWDLNLSQQELLEEAALLGSDVPFFIYGGTVLAEGRGEKLTQLAPLKPSWIVLLNPGLPMPPDKTKQLYKMLYRSDFSDGSVTRLLVNNLQNGKALVPSLLFNTFERVAYERFPDLDQFRAAMVEAGADYVRISGSGPTLFTLIEDETIGEEILKQLHAQELAAYLVKTI
jgi:4-diphosphocytidyl-2-C-methyl-D-erythritol kinase